VDSKQVGEGVVVLTYEPVRAGQGEGHGPQAIGAEAG
jgi:hypothetical protein